MANEAGTYTIPAASIEVGGEKIFSNALTIKVLPPDNTQQSGGQGGQRGSASSSRGQMAGSRITDKDLFITLLPARLRYTSRKLFS